MDAPWESELARFLQDLLAAQDKMLDVLVRKRRMILDADAAGLSAVAGEEARLMETLQACLDRRDELLERARRDGLPAGSIRSLSAAVASPSGKGLVDQARQASHRARLLQHHSLTNWVLVQKTLIHLSQLLEIIATGGRIQPTYGKGQPVCATGALVDREV